MQDKRSSTRHDVALPVTISIGSQTFERQIDNLSLGGALISHDSRLPMGARVQLAFKVPTQEQAIEVGGAVRWSTELAAGVQFDGLRARDVWSLNKYFELLD